MREIFAIIQINRINATKAALAQRGIYSLNAFPALGHGQGVVDEDVLQAAASGKEEAIALLGEHTRLVPKRSLSVMVPADRVNDVVEAIIEANHTGHHGDGKIYVCPVEEAIRIRTGETGHTALN